jgi:hypothetical protein
MNPAAAVAAAMMFFSCMITLNPDGSGKAVVEVRQSVRQAGPGPGVDPPELFAARAAKAAHNILVLAKGVDAWADVSQGVTADGQATFKATVYFGDVSKMRLTGQTFFETVPATWTKDPKGGMVLKVDMSPPADRPKPPQMTPEQLAKEVAQSRARWTAERQKGIEVTTGGKVDLSFRLPGTVDEVAGFQKEADGLIHLRPRASDLVPVVDAFLADEKALGESIQSGTWSVSHAPAVVEKIYGAKMPFIARVAEPMKPQFDYAAEVKKALAAQPAMMKGLGIEHMSPTLMEPASYPPPGVPRPTGSTGPGTNSRMDARP